AIDLHGDRRDQHDLHDGDLVAHDVEEKSRRERREGEADSARYRRSHEDRAQSHHERPEVNEFLQRHAVTCDLEYSSLRKGAGGATVRRGVALHAGIDNALSRLSCTRGPGFLGPGAAVLPSADHDLIWRSQRAWFNFIIRHVRARPPIRGEGPLFFLLPTKSAAAQSGVAPIRVVHFEGISDVAQLARKTASESYPYSRSCSGGKIASAGIRFARMRALRSAIAAASVI